MKKTILIILTLIFATNSYAVSTSGFAALGQSVGQYMMDAQKMQLRQQQAMELMRAYQQAGVPFDPNQYIQQQEYLEQLQKIEQQNAYNQSEVESLGNQVRALLRQ